MEGIFYQELDKFVGELYSDGTVAKWDNERLEKSVKKAIRKTTQKVKEAKERLCETRPVRAA